MNTIGSYRVAVVANDNTTTINVTFITSDMYIHVHDDTNFIQTQVKVKKPACHLTFMEMLQSRSCLVPRRVKEHRHNLPLSHC